MYLRVLNTASNEGDIGYLSTRGCTIHLDKLRQTSFVCLGKHPLFVWLSVSGVKTGTRFVIHLDEQPSVVQCSSHTKENSLSRQVLRLGPVLILETNNQKKKNVCASSSRQIMHPLI